VGAPPWNIEAIGNCGALELWRLTSQTGTDLAVSVTKVLFYLFNFVVFVVKGSCYWTECDGLHFYQRNFINRYHESFHNVFLSNFSLLSLHR